MFEKLWSIVSFDITPAQARVVGRVAWRMAIAAHIAIACGWATSFGISGFASASEVDVLRKSMSTIASELLDQRILDTRLKQCTATSPEAKRLYTEKMQELLSRYQETMRRDYRLPSCDEVRI